MTLVGTDVSEECMHMLVSRGHNEHQNWVIKIGKDRLKMCHISSIWELSNKSNFDSGGN
jgi:hypothetical protein